MDSEDKFRQSLKDLVESKEFPFEEMDWDRAGAYINRQRGGARLRLAAFFVLSAGAIATVIALLLQTPADQTEKPLAQTTGVAAAPEQTRIDLSKEPNAVNTPDTPSVADQQGIARPETAFTSHETAEVNRKPAKTTQRGRARISMTEVRPEQPAGEKVVPPVTPPPAIADRRETDQEKQANASVPGKEEPIVQAEEPVDEKPGEIVSGEVPAPAIAPDGDSTAVSDSVATPPGEPVEEPADAVVANGNAPEEQPEPRVMPVLSVEGGADLCAGWNAGDKEAAGVSPFAGIHYASPVTDRFKLSFGLQYHQVSSLGAFTHTSSVTRLSFGEEREMTEITPRKLHYVAVPVRLLYKIDDKNTAGIGCVISYLTDVESRVTTYTETFSGRQDETTFTSRGYADGFATFDTQLTLQYRRRLVPRLWLKAEFRFGLTDLKDDVFFSAPGAQRNSGARFGIVFDLNQTR